MVTNPSNEKFDIIILAGQSNASGCGIGPTTMLWSFDQDILMMKGRFLRDDGNEFERDASKLKYSAKYTLSVADERPAEGYRRGVLALPFAKRYKEEFLSEDRKILIVDTALGGTGFCSGHWTLDGGLYVRMVDMVENALSMNAENRVVALLWHQGEMDTARSAKYTEQELYDRHYLNVSILVKDVRARFGDMPFICGGFNNEWFNNTPRAVITEQAQKDVARDLGKGAFCQGNDLLSNNQITGKGEAVHFNRESVYILGNRYFDAYKEIVKGE